MARILKNMKLLQYGNGITFYGKKLHMSYNNGHLKTPI